MRGPINNDNTGGFEMKFTQDWIADSWSDSYYYKIKEQNFYVLDNYLTVKPKRLLDIGCGLAWEPRLFSEKHSTEIWLMDGDLDLNENRSSDIGYHSSADKFLFYNKLETLNSELIKLQTQNYHLVDCNNISIPENIKFDVITSWFSCGFHYPINTYRDLILKHSHENTIVVVDIRVHEKTDEIFYPEENVEIVDILAKNRKRITAHIKVK